MRTVVEEFSIYLKNNKRKSENTIMSYKRDLNSLIDFLEKNNITSYDKVTSTNINSYVLEMEKLGKSPATIARNISSINTFFRYLLVKGYVKGEPTEFVKAPKVSKKLPSVLSDSEIDRLVMQPNNKDAKGLRDKAMLELLVSTGIRVSELINIEISDVNLQLGYLVCKNEKKDRVIPFGNKVNVALSRYLNEDRVEDAEGDLLFLNCFGKKMSRQGVWKIIKTYAKKAGIEKEITPQMFRHSFGVNKIKSGKSVEEVQEMMGHTDISSTSIYKGM
ncbi:MAG: tyrosine-type recombinase/integrase [Lachnospiraceae bacterium]|nr:tyrosine-type recombinase/integrase [Lachnospiraceae bacterium]